MHKRKLFFYLTQKAMQVFLESKLRPKCKKNELTVKIFSNIFQKIGRQKITQQKN